MTNKNSNLQIYLPIAFALTMIVGMQIGFKLYENLKLKLSPAEYLSTYSGNETINEVLNFIEAKYVDTLDSKRLSERVIKETLEELDPHSNYITSGELKKVNESLKGSFEGIGIEFFISKDTLYVSNVIKDGPSELAGVLTGDKIVQIEDSVIVGSKLKTESVISLLKGEKGSPVTIWVARQNKSELHEFTIIRDKIPYNSLAASYMVDDEIGYIKLDRFSATTYHEFGTALAELTEKGIKKLILDLRQNPGGYLEAATQIADELISGKKMVVYTEGRNYKRKEYFCKKYGLFEDGELIILIDQDSASASEILAGAIQDLDRGLVIGRRSFGKGLVQEQHTLSDKSAIRLTVARYYTPSGRSIQKFYEKGEENSYNREISERYENGELFNEDSLKMQDTTKYFTLANRVVYGGGGIVPDIFVPIDTSKFSSDYLRARLKVQGFVIEHFSQNTDTYAAMGDLQEYKRSFNVNAGMIQDLYDFLNSIDFKFNRANIEENMVDLKTTIKAHIARLVWQNQGYYSILEQTDEIFLTAINEMKNPQKMAALLKNGEEVNAR